MDSEEYKALVARVVHDTNETALRLWNAYLDETNPILRQRYAEQYVLWADMRALMQEESVKCDS